MGNKMKRFLSMALVLAMLSTNSLTALATESVESTQTETHAATTVSTEEANTSAGAKNETTGETYKSVADALDAASEGDTVILLKDEEASVVSVIEDVTLDLNGHTLEASYVTCFGNIVDESDGNTGLLKVETKRFLIQDKNEQLPVKNGEGYQFFKVEKFNKAWDKEKAKYAFQPCVESSALDLIMQGTEVTGVTVNVRVSWTQGDGLRTQDFTYNDEMANKFFGSYNSETGKFGQMFTLVLNGTAAFEELTFCAVLVSDTGVEIASEPITVDTKDDTQNPDDTGKPGDTENPGNTGSSDVTTDENNKVTGDVQIEAGQASANVSAGTQLDENTNELKLTVKEMEVSDNTIEVEEKEEVRSVDVHVDGVAENNTVPIIITVDEFAPEFLNQGNIRLYHVEDGTPVEMTRVFSLEEVDEHNEYYYDPATGIVTMALATFSEVAVVSDTENGWNGVFDYELDGEGTEENPYIIATADELAGFGAIVGGMNDGATPGEGNSFAGETVKLLADINLGDAEAENNPDLIFYPIGYYNSTGSYEKVSDESVTSNVSSFEGVFDGNGHTISNFYQNTWEMFGDYNDGYSGTPNYYKDAMGLFGYVVNGIVKNLTVDNFSSDGEFTPTGVIAAYAVNSTFENIAITNCNPRVYNTGNGGIVGIGGSGDDDKELRFTNITIDNSNKITALWGSWDVACGGLVGMFRGAGHAYMTNCHVAAQMDVYNDVCGNYQYYWYRYAGMMIGTNKNMVEENGYTVPETEKFHAENCTVHFGEWNDYYYCELVANSLASYTHDHQFSRLEQVKAIDVYNMKVISMKGETTDIPTSGRYNYVVVDDSVLNGSDKPSTEKATCYHFVDGNVWNHAEAGEETVDVDGDGIKETVLKEDRQHYYLPFNQLFTGYGWGVKHIPVYNGDDYAFKGITILDREVADSVVKFEKADTANESYTTGTTVTIGDLFKATEAGLADKTKIDKANVQVTVSPVDDSTAGGTYAANTTDWTKGTLIFSGLGAAQIIITDYNFCEKTVLNVTIEDRQSVEKFASKIDRDYDFLYRVGNLDEFPVAVLFKAIEGAEIDTANVDITVTSETESITGIYTANVSDWTKGTLKIEGAGLVTISITDNDYCTPTEVTVEVIAAKNAYSGTVPDAISTNVVLLEDVSDNGFTVSGARNYFYGNGFTVTCAGNGAYGNATSGGKSLFVGYVTVEKGGTLDNVKVKCNLFPESYMFTSELVASGGTYPYSRPAVTISEDSTISGCYIYGARVNILVRGGNVTIKDTITDSGALANIHIISESRYTVTLEDVTTIQSLKDADFDATKKVLGFAVAVGTTDSTSNPTIKLLGDLRQYNWVTQDDADAATGTYSSGIIGGALAVEKYQHTINGKTAVNLGIAYVMKDLDINIKEEDKRTNKNDIPYELNEVTMKILGNNLTGKVYSIVNSELAASRYDTEADNVVSGMVNTNSDYIPQFKVKDDLGEQKVEAYDGCDEYCYLEDGTIKMMFVSGDTKEFDLSSLVSITKYTGQTLDPVITCVDEKGDDISVTDGKISLVSAGEYTLTYTVKDTIVYEQNGTAKEETTDQSWNVPLSVTLKDVSVSDAYFEFDSSKQVIYADPTNWLGNGDYKQNMPFLAGLKIYDYLPGEEEAYLRFDGNNDFAKIAKATIENINTTGEASGYHIITVELTDGGKLVIDLDVRATSGGSTHTGSIKVSNNVLYVVNGGTTSAKGQQWKVYDYEFTGNNGVVINSGAVTFGTSGTDATTNTAPSANFGTTIKYTVTYDANEGNCGQTIGYATSASASVTLPTPTRSGYMFTGWYTAASGGDRVGGAGDSYTPSANVTLYAQWGKPSTVTYNANGGSVTPASEKYTGTALILPTPTRDGYWFTGWYDAATGGNKIGVAGAGYQATGDITLYAHWSPIYTVTYNANGGSVTPASEKYTGTALALPMPTRDGYAFDGWYTAATGGNKVEGSYTPTANITLYAQWKDPVTVTYDANGGECSTASQTYLGTTLELPTPTAPTGYKFDGWYDSATGGSKIGVAGASYTPTGDITLYAQWTGCVVKYNANSGSCSTASQTYAGTALTLPTATRSNYTFNGWYTAATGGSKIGVAGESYTPTADITLYAQWTYSGGCVTPDTLVTLADGTQKRIDELTYEDEFIVWDFVKGESAITSAAIINNHGYTSYTVTTLEFEDGTRVNTIDGHGFYHKDTNEFVMLSDKNVEEYVGHKFLKQDMKTLVELVDYSITTEEVESWSILTAEHHNAMLNGMFTLTPGEIEGSEKYLMPFKVNDNLKYDEEARMSDIEKYGLYTYEDFEEYVTYEQFEALNLPIFKVSVGKGYITYEDIIFLLELHCK